MNRFLLAAVLILSCGWVAAAPDAGPVRTEIDALLTTLRLSGCQFDRNGSWYSGAEAKIHLLRKLDYFEGKGSVQSTEQFIELAASKSSSSGKPYQVKCVNESAMESSQWLSRQLVLVRGQTSKTKP